MDTELDREAFLWVVEHRAAWLDVVFVALSVVGYAGLVWIALAPALAIWTKRGVLSVTVMTALCVWAADLVALALKDLADRPRPFETLPDADPLLGGTVGESFPSGHAATSFAGAVALAFLVRRAVPALFVLALAVSFSRVYVGVHYPVDVLAGGVVGAAVAAGALTLSLRALPRPSGGRRRSAETPPPG